MPPTGSGVTRKSHTKSRKGCGICKRRHIRCDEAFPQCKNCSKHNVRCDYMDGPSPPDDRPSGPKQPNLLSTPKIDHEIEGWQRTGLFPFPEMNLQHTQQFHGLAPIDLRLIHHLSSIYRDMRLADFVKCTLWIQEIPSFFDAAYGHEFVTSAILAFSATHIAWLTKSAETKNLAYRHRGTALSGLHQAIGDFSEENSDAILAASILLSWQASDWGDWTSLMQGISTVISSMSAWKHLSRYSLYIDDHPSFFSASSTSLTFDDQSFYLATDALHQLSARLPNVHPLAQRLHDIEKFAENFQSCSASMQSEQLFDLLQPLRAWLFWMPVSLVKANDMSSSAMVLLAQLYSLALAVDSSLPELNGAALGSLTVSAIDQIDIKLRSKIAINIPGEMTSSDLDSLMQFARLASACNQRSMSADAPQTQAERQQSPYNFHRLSIESQPGTPNYPPPGSPGTLGTFQMLASRSFDDLSIPPSPFLHYGASHSRRQSQFGEASPRPSEHSFDNRSTSGFSVHDSPAYSPAYSPAFLPEMLDEESWDFGRSSPSLVGGDIHYDESSILNKQPRMV